MTSRALLGAGTAGLVATPMLMTISLATGVPAAVPAIIALGYFAVAHVLKRGGVGRANALSLGLMLSFLIWTVVFCMSDAGTGSAAAITTALLAPAFAAAPGIARRMMASADHSLAERAAAHAATLASCAPAQAVLFTGPEGIVAAATPAARELLGASEARNGSDLAGALRLDVRPALLGALRRAAMLQKDAEVPLHLFAGGQATAFIRLVEPGLLSVRLDRSEQVPKSVSDYVPERGRSDGNTMHAASVDDAISFAARRTADQLTAKGLDLDCTVDENLGIACDHGTLRQILLKIFEATAALSHDGARIAVSARKVRGATLLRVEAAECDEQITRSCRAVAERLLAQASAFVDRAGGSMIEKPRGGVRSISVRLPQADIGTLVHGKA